MLKDSIATALVIQMMPLLMREFQIRLDPQLLFTDQAYADSVLDLAGTAVNVRLRNCSFLLRDRLRALGSGPVGAARSASVDIPLDVTGPHGTTSAASGVAADPPSDNPASSAPDKAAAPASPSDADKPAPGKRYVRSLR